MQSVEPVNGHQPEADLDFPEVVPMPPVGGLVVYVPRPNESRRMQFPALVMATEPGGGCELLVFVDAGNLVSQRHVAPWRTGERGWRHVAAAVGQTVHVGGIAKDLHEQIKALSEGMAAKVFGDYEQPGVPLMELIVQLTENAERLDKRVAALEQRGKASASVPAQQPARGKKR